MEREQFDILARLVWSQRSRRTALATLLGAALVGYGSDPGVAKRKNKNRRKKHRSCYPATSCLPGQGRDNAGCDFSLSLEFFEGHFQGSNFSHANFTGAELAGANLQGVDLGGACLVGANLLGADLGGANLKGAIFCQTLMPDGTFNDQDCGKGTRCCPAPVSSEGAQSPAECIGAPNAQCSLNVPYGGCCPGLRCVFSSTNPIRTTCQAPCGNDTVCHRFGAGWHCAHEPVLCRYLRGECCQHI